MISGFHPEWPLTMVGERLYYFKCMIHSNFVLGRVDLNPDVVSTNLNLSIPLRWAWTIPPRAVWWEIKKSSSSNACVTRKSIRRDELSKVGVPSPSPRNWIGGGSDYIKLFSFRAYVLEQRTILTLYPTEERGER